MTYLNKLSRTQRLFALLFCVLACYWLSVSACRWRLLGWQSSQPGYWNRSVWRQKLPLVAIALILGGGLVALQAMAVSTGFPFTLVLLAACVAVVKGLLSEPRAA